jgi:hypothetical protein
MKLVRSRILQGSMQPRMPSYARKDGLMERIISISPWLMLARKREEVYALQGGVCIVTGGDGNSFVCGIESLNDERFAAAGHSRE